MTTLTDNFRETRKSASRTRTPPDADERYVEIVLAGEYLTDEECAAWEAQRARLRRELGLPAWDESPAEEQERAA